MVIAHHLIWTAYGWWLPNDPRGSMSRHIRNEVLMELGELHHGRKKLQPCSRIIREFYEEAVPFLKHPLLAFIETEFHAIAQGLDRAIDQRGYHCYACAIMPDHIHILIRKHRDKAEEMIAHLQRESHLAAREAGIRSMTHPVWGGHGWKVFLDTPEDITRTIRYVELNPVKIGLPKQLWSFVSKYDNWPYHRKIKR